MASQQGRGGGGGTGSVPGTRAGAVLGLTLVALLAAGCPVSTQRTYGDAAIQGTGSGGAAASGGKGGTTGTGGGPAGGQGGSNGSGGSAGTGGAPADGGTDRPADAGSGGAPGCVPTCAAPTPVCDLTSRTCVGCLSSTTCAAPTPVCDTAGSRTCVGCLSNTNCAGTTTPVCDLTSHTCVGCLANTSCMGATPVCDPTSHTCVGCLSNTNCSGTKPICSATTKTCGACMTNPQCAMVASTTPACRTDGSCAQCNVKMDCAGMTATPACFEGKCVGCTLDSECTDSTKPICNQTTHSCVPCTADTQCMAKNTAAPACITTAGAGQGTCVACTTHTQCTTATKPVCVANVCSACTSDAQCVAKSGADPGVCMFHTDGHCATNTEVLYVKPVSACDDNGSGTATTPFCTPQRAIAATTATKNVVVIRKGMVSLVNWTFAGATPTTVIGQGGAVIGPQAGIGIAVISGSLYIRNLGVSGMLDVGVSVAAGATIKMDGCIVTTNNGGLSVNGGGFEINNSVFADNAAAATPVAFGGVYLKAGVGTPKQFRNNTVYGNAGPGLVCDGTYPVRGLMVMNNVGGQITACDFADLSSVVATATTNAAFDTAPGRAYHLTADSPCVDVGKTTDFSNHDLDGNPRPSPANGLPDCGAHELQK